MPDQPILDAHPAARGLAAAARGETLVVATGVQWTAFMGTYAATDAGDLGRVPDSAPGCPMRLDVADLVVRPSGWFAVFDLFECDVSGSQHRFYESDRLAPITELETIWPGIGGAVAFDDGAFAVTRARSGVDTRLLWFREPGLSPEERTIGANGTDVALARWPEGDEVVAGFLTDDGEGPAVTMVLLDRRGAVREQQTAPLPDRARFGAYGPVGIELATTDFGVIAAIELAWLGGRIDSGYVVMGFDRTMRPTLGSLVELDSGSGRSEISLAGAGDEALVSVFTGTIEETTAESILIGCSP